MAPEAAPRYRWAILAACALAFLPGTADRSVWSVALPYVSGSLALPMSMLTGFVSASTLGYLLGLAVGGPVSDWLGGRVTLAVSTLGLAAFTALFAFTQVALVGQLVQGFIGFCAGAGYPAAVALVVTWFGPGRRGFGVGLLLAAAPLGRSVTPMVGAFLVDVFDWHFAYLAFGVATAVIGVVALLVLRDRPRAASPAGPAGGMQVDALLLLAAAGFGAFWAAGGYLTWVIAAARDRGGLEPSEIGAALALSGAAAVVGQPLFGLLWDRLRQPAWVPIGSLALFAALLVAIPALPGLSAMLVALPLLVLGASAYAPPLAVMVAEAAGPGRIGAATGLTAAFAQGAGLVVPPVAAGLFELTGASGPALGLLAVGPLLGIVCLVVVRGLPVAGLAGAQR